MTLIAGKKIWSDPDFDFAAPFGDIVEKRCWVYWAALANKDKPNEMTKIPFNPHREMCEKGSGAKSNDPSTWGTLSEAKAAMVRVTDGGRAVPLGLGLMIDPTLNGLVGVDLDNVVDDDLGMDPIVEQMIDVLGTYAELSPSGHGVKFVCRGHWPETAMNRYGKLEIYNKVRFFTLTGIPICDKPVADAQKALTALAGSKRWPSRKTPKAAVAKVASARPKPASRRNDPDVRLTMMRIAASRSSGTWLCLFNGDDSGHDDDTSRADLSFCSMTALHTDDPDVVDIIFRSSKRMRDKWDDRRGGSTYGEITVARALEWAEERREDPGDN